MRKLKEKVYIYLKDFVAFSPEIVRELSWEAELGVRLSGVVLVEVFFVHLKIIKELGGQPEPSSFSAFRHALFLEREREGEDRVREGVRVECFE